MVKFNGSSPVFGHQGRLGNQCNVVMWSTLVQIMAWCLMTITLTNDDLASMEDYAICTEIAQDISP